MARTAHSTSTPIGVDLGVGRRRRAPDRDQAAALRDLFPRIVCPAAFHVLWAALAVLSITLAVIGTNYVLSTGT